MGFTRNPAVWIILILLIVVLFGASRLPDITRNVGKSMKIFKQEVRELSDDTPPAGSTPPTPQPGSQPTTNQDPEAQDPPHAPPPPGSSR